MNSDQQFWWNWWVNLIVAVSTFLAVLVALFGERLRVRIFPPLLKLKLVRQEGEKTRLTTSVPGESGYTTEYVDDARFYHLRVSNERRWSPATSVRVYLTRLEEPGPSEALQLVWVGNVPIRWRDQEVVPLLQTIGAAADCDLCRVERRGGLFLMPLIVPNSLEAHRTGKCKLVVTLQARSTEADSEVLRVGIYWDGRWEDGDAEMKKHLVIDEIPSPPLKE